MAEFGLALPHILEHEGGSAFTNDPDDPGGATRWGVSLRYLLARGDLDRDGLPDGDVDGDGDVDADDVRHMPRHRAAFIYRTGFWDPNRLDEVVSQGVANKLVDAAVNVGSSQAWRLAQRAHNALGTLSAPLIVDGRVGPRTLFAVNCVPSNAFLRRVCAEQRAFYEALIVARPRLDKYRRGWTCRAAWPYTLTDLGWRL